MGKACDTSNIEYILCISTRDDVESYLEAFRDVPVQFVFLSDNGLVKQVNEAAKHSKGDLLIAVSDDFGCPDNWDRLLVDALSGKSDYIVKTKDGLQPFIITLPIMDRVYYNRFGYIYHPDYNHMYGDEELADIGKILGKTVTLDLYFPHRHYSTGKMKRDATNVQNDSYYGVDGDTYRRRKENNFYL